MKIVQIQIAIRSDGNFHVYLSRFDGHVWDHRQKWENVDRVDISFPKGWPVKGQLKVRRP